MTKEKKQKNLRRVWIRMGKKLIRENLSTRNLSSHESIAYGEGFENGVARTLAEIMHEETEKVLRDLLDPFETRGES